MKENEIKKSVAKILAKGLKNTLYVEANTTGCVFAYQPKAPEELADYRKTKR